MIAAIALVVPLSFCFFLLVRNERVSRYRSRWIKWAYAQPDWRYHSRGLDAVSYDSMVWQFWRPLKSFAPNTHHQMTEWEQTKLEQWHD